MNEFYRKSAGQSLRELESDAGAGLTAAEAARSMIATSAQITF